MIRRRKKNNGEKTEAIILSQILFHVSSDFININENKKKKKGKDKKNESRARKNTHRGREGERERSNRKKLNTD